MGPDRFLFVQIFDIIWVWKLKTLSTKRPSFCLRTKKFLVALSKGRDKWYIPGGKREKHETYEQALVRESKEELQVDLVESSIKPYGIFQAQAHAKPPGVMVQMTCYTADYQGIPKPDNEIEKIDWFGYSQKDLTAPVDHLIFDDLKSKNLID